MANTMADLRRECAIRLRETLHGREIDMLDKYVSTPHMLGVVPIGVNSNHEVEKGTILDHNHEFWQEFEENVNTKNGAERRIQSAIRSLKKDDVFTMTYPYGEDADIVYCEVDEFEQGSNAILPTTCAECGHTIEAPLSLDYHEGHDGRGSYTLGVQIDCPHCDFTRYLESGLQRQ